MKIPNIVIWQNMTDLLGRVYDEQEIRNEIFLMFNENKTQLLGELGYGNGANSVALDRVSHYFENLRIEDREDGTFDMVGDLVVMKTPLGLILEKLLEAGVKLRTSVRSTGYVDDMKVSKVKVTTIDIVQIDNVNSDKERVNVFLP